MALDSWDDLRFLLAVHRAGTLTGGAQALGVDPTTVSRRLRAFEDREGVELFDRLRGGVELTARGEAYAQTAADLEERVLALERRVSGTAAALEGSVRLTIPQILACAWIDELARFARAHPKLSLELVADERIRSLTRREADVALRYAKTPPEHLVGRKLGRPALAVYGAPAFRDVPVEELPWIGWEPGIGAAESILERFRRRFSPRGEYVIYATSMLVNLEAARRGVGVTVLTCLSGDVDPRLVRLTDPISEGIPLWVLTHPDLQHSARVRALVDHIVKMVADSRDRL